MLRILLVSLAAAFAMHASAMQIFLINQLQPSCTAASGLLGISVVGGTPPYTYAWSNGGTTDQISGLIAGYYEVTVTDNVGGTATEGWTLVAAGLISFQSAQDGHASCVGDPAGEVQVIESGINGTPPYVYNPAPTGTDAQGDPVFFTGTPPGSIVSIHVVDAMGCSGTITETVMSPQLIGGPNMTVSNIHGSCSAGTGGSATVLNVNDGSFFQAPQLSLLDASDNYAGGNVTGGSGGSVNITGVGPGSYHLLRNWDPSGFLMAYPCDGNPFDRIDFTIPDLGPNCGSVSGTVYIDNDQDCTQDVAEVGVPYEVLEIQPGPQYAITGSSGHYGFDVVDGSYSIAQTDPTLIQLCPVATPIPFTIATNQSVINMADSSTVPLDLGTLLEASPMRPGFNVTYWGLVGNSSPQVSGPVTITMTIDGGLLYLGASPTPTNVAGNTITWDLSPFTAYGSVNIIVSVQVPVGTALGTLLSSTLDVQNTLTDADLSNNTTMLNAYVVGSFDPNEKTARTSTGASTSQYFIDEDQWIDYSIRFQNTGTDTAFTVTVTDTLAPELDMASFEQGVASHPFAIKFKSGRVVEWTFANILLPDSGTNEAGSHGLVNFRIKPIQPLNVGTEITNTANIFFDFNDPVITAPSVLAVEIGTGVMAQESKQGLWLMPNPTSGMLEVRVSDRNAATGLLQVVAVDGRVVLERRMEGPRTVLDVSSLARGIYTINWRDTNGTSTTQRFVRD